MKYLLLVSTEVRCGYVGVNVATFKSYTQFSGYSLELVIHNFVFPSFMKLPSITTLYGTIPRTLNFAIVVEILLILTLLSFSAITTFTLYILSCVVMQNYTNKIVLLFVHPFGIIDFSISLSVTPSSQNVNASFFVAVCFCHTEFLWLLQENNQSDILLFYRAVRSLFGY